MTENEELAEQAAAAEAEGPGAAKWLALAGLILAPLLGLVLSLVFLTALAWGIINGIAGLDASWRELLAVAVTVGLVNLRVAAGRK